MLHELFTDPSAPIGTLPPKAIQALSEQGTFARLPKGAAEAHQGYPHASELILLSGQMVALVTDSEGRSVCLGMFEGPCVITPHIARSDGGRSLVSLEVCKPSEFVRIPALALQDLMVADPYIREWGNEILHRALVEKTGREWCLAALGAAARLEWFRAQYSGFEDRFAHKHIASFLGMTPVSLSRLRAQAS